MEIPILQDIVVILGLSVAIIYVFQRLKLPPILGLLLTGIIAGPKGFALVRAVHEVELMAEVGVILLLFIIGLEFSLKTLASLKREILLGGGLQVLLTIGLVMLVGLGVGLTWEKAVFVGFLISLSSTAIVLKLLQSKGEANAPHGRIALAILIFQDIIVVPMMLLTPLLAGDMDIAAGTNVWWLLGQSVLVVTAVLFGASYFIPRVLEAVAKTRNRELFILTVIVICFAVAWGTNQAGLSLALGAFLAGLIISESEYSYQATGIVLPFREIFTSFFFVSIGMLLDMQFLITHIGPILLLVLAVVLIKMSVVGLAVLLLGYPRRTIALTAFTLFQVGEFAFILAAVGLKVGVLDDTTQQYFLATSILTMALTPFVMDYGEIVAGWWVKRSASSHTRLSARLERQSAQVEELTEDLRDHVIVIGYGLNGKNLVRVARKAQIPYVVLEMNPLNVQEARDEGVPVYFGDATNEVVLEHLKVYNARVAVITITDPAGAKQIVHHIRNICNTVHIIVRTHYVKDVEELYSLGANEVVPEEFETSIEIFTRLLNKYLIPRDEIDSFVRYIRNSSKQNLQLSEGLTAFRSPALDIPDINVTCIKVRRSDDGVLAHKTLQELDLRARHGITIAAIQREGQYITAIAPSTEILPEDRLYVMGSVDAIAAFGEMVH